MALSFSCIFHYEILTCTIASNTTLVGDFNGHDVLPETNEIDFCQGIATY